MTGVAAKLHASRVAIMTIVLEDPDRYAHEPRLDMIRATRKRSYSVPVEPPSEPASSARATPSRAPHVAAAAQVRPSLSRTPRGERRPAPSRPARPEEPDYDIRPKVILDYWGTPIRYYRNPYNGGDPGATIDSLDLADVFSLRPWSFKEGVLVEGVADSNGDRSSSSQLQSAEFALMSLGADRRQTPGTRVDQDEFNSDNIVELGP